MYGLMTRKINPIAAAPPMRMTRRRRFRFTLDAGTSETAADDKPDTPRPDHGLLGRMKRFRPQPGQTTSCAARCRWPRSGRPQEQATS
jgi:hypothetical protein